MARLESLVKGGFYSTPERVVAALVPMLLRPATGGRRVVRLLDPCAGTGEPAAVLGAALGAQTYGIELNEVRAAAARGRLDRLLCGDTFATRLSNGAFSLLFCNPPYHDDEEKLRLEHRFLQHLSRALCPGGLLLFVIPQRRLEVSARYLASHYERLAAWRFPDPEWAAFGQIVLVGAKKPWATLDPAAERLVRAWSVGDLPVLPDGLTDGATLPPGADRPGRGGALRQRDPRSPGGRRRVPPCGGLGAAAGGRGALAARRAPGPPADAAEEGATSAR